ncbi:MAG: hypothetical protein RL441_377 [Actinomycetota bacterium]
MDSATQVIAWRRELHKRAEVGFELPRTVAYLREALTDLGLELSGDIGGGFVATLTNGDGPTIGIRADMDGLSISESTGKQWTSEQPQSMHACGHDGHMAMALGAAAALTNSREFSGTIHFVFQPAEEPGHGAQSMMAAGLFDRYPMDAMFGLHNLHGVPAGSLHTRPGAIMASEDLFEIHIHGRGGHASRPEAVVDPLVIGAEIVTALQSIVSRSVAPTDVAVVSCTEFISDGARNAIPSNVIIKGDTRSFDPEVQATLERRMRELVAGVCAAHGATSEVIYTHEFAPTINDARSTETAVAAAISTVGESNVNSNCPAWAGSEDFGQFAKHVPANFTFLGIGVDASEGGVPLHSRDYDFNDNVLDVGVRYYVDIVTRLLPRGASA